MVIFFPEIRQHDRMHMCVHEAGDHTFSLKVRDRSVKIRERCPQPGPENPAVPDEHGISPEIFVVGCKYVSVYE